MSSTSTVAPPHTSNAWFVTTHWSVVLSARQKDSPGCGAALESLCRTYWYPLYAFVRRQGHSPEDAQDLTQAFFARLLEKDFLRLAAQEKGKFRSFMLVALKRFLINDWKQGQAIKRGGGQARVPLAGHSAETRYLAEPAVRESPEKLYDRRWAVALIETVLEQLRKEFALAGKEGLFNQLKTYLMAEKGGIPYAEAGARIGMSEAAVRVAVHRLRRRFREVFRDEVAHTVATPQEIDEEIRYLLGTFNSA